MQTSAARFTRCDLKVVRAQGKSRIMAGDLRASAARAVAMISSRLYFLEESVKIRIGEIEDVRRRRKRYHILLFLRHRE